jgi:hypothetical protein
VHQRTTPRCLYAGMSRSWPCTYHLVSLPYELERSLRLHVEAAGENAGQVVEPRRRVRLQTDRSARRATIQCSKDMHTSVRCAAMRTAPKAAVYAHAATSSRLARARAVPPRCRYHCAACACMRVIVRTLSEKYNTYTIGSSSSAAMM